MKRKEKPYKQKMMPNIMQELQKCSDECSHSARKFKTGSAEWQAWFAKSDAYTHAAQIVTTYVGL